MRKSRWFVAMALVLVLVQSGGSALAGPGTQLWVRRYNGSGNGSDLPFSVAVSPDGATVFVTGVSAGSTTGDDYATIAYDAATGVRLWTKRYNGSGNGADSAGSIAVAPGGATVFVTGTSAGLTSGDDFATIAYDAATGAEIWTKSYNGPGNDLDYGPSVAVSPDGATVFVTGPSSGSTTGMDYATIAYDAATGAQAWAKRYNGPGNGTDHPWALALSPEGASLYVTGASQGSVADLDYATIAYDTDTGVRLWVKRYNGPGTTPYGSDEATSVAVAPDGTSVFVTGGSPGDPSSDHYQDYATIAYDAATGATRWTTRYSGLGGGRDIAYSIDVAPDGITVFVTGQSVYDYATIAYDASTGTDVWTRRYSGPGSGEDAAFSLGVSPDGTTVFVTGGSAGYTTGFDYGTIAYSASAGVDLWTKRYRGPGNGDDVAYDIAVATDGTKVFVTGVSAGSTSGYDYATIAYEV